MSYLQDFATTSTVYGFNNLSKGKLSVFADGKMALDDSALLEVLEDGTLYRDFNLKITVTDLVSGVEARFVPIIRIIQREAESDEETDEESS